MNPLALIRRLLTPTPAPIDARTRRIMERAFEQRLAARKANRPDPRAYWIRQAKESAKQVARDPLLHEQVKL